MSRRKTRLFMHIALWAVLAILLMPIPALVTRILFGDSLANAESLGCAWLSWWADPGPAPKDLGIAAVVSTVIVGITSSQHSDKGRTGDGGPLGSASVESRPTRVLKASDTWDGRRAPSGCGVVYGYERGRFLYEGSCPHSITVSATGAGKTRFLVMPTIALMSAYGANLIVSDVKNELIELMGDGLNAVGYDVRLLDLQHPRRGDRYNPIAQVVADAKAGYVMDAQTEAATIAQALVPNEGSESSHWVNSARALVTCCILMVAFADDCPDDARTMCSVCRTLNEGTESPGDDPAQPLKDYLRSLPSDHPARAYASQMLSTRGNEQASIISTAKVSLTPYASGDMAWMTSASDIDPHRVLTTKTALFLHVMDEGSPYNALFSMLFDQLYRECDRVCDENGGSLPVECDIIGDEWGNLPRVPSLAALTSLGRSKGLRWHGFVQNISQLNKYGKDTDRPKILANCGVKVAIRLNEAEDCTYFSEAIGKTTRHTLSSGTSSSRGGTTTSRSQSETADYVIHPWEWRERAASRDGVVVIKSAEEGAPRSHAGVFATHVADVASTPARDLFDLGTREHEAARKASYQQRLIKRAQERADDSVTAWCPQWPTKPDQQQSSGCEGMLSGGLVDEFSDFTDDL